MSALISCGSRLTTPRQPISSAIVKHSWISPWGMFCSCTVRTASSAAAMPTLSSPPKVVVPSECSTPSLRTTFVPVVGGTESICASKNNLVAPSTLPGKKAHTLPVVPSILLPASSTFTSSPMARNFCTSRSASAFSSLLGQGTLTSSINSFNILVSLITATTSQIIRYYHYNTALPTASLLQIKKSLLSKPALFNDAL